MKIITLTQPWATLVAIGAKRIETRSWATRYRGLLGIHAGKSMNMQQRMLCYSDPFARELQRAGFDAPSKLPRSALLCVVRLADIVPTSRVRDQLTSNERAFGDYGDDRYAWLLDHFTLHRLAVPIECRGHQGLWKPTEIIITRLNLQGITGVS